MFHRLLILLTCVSVWGGAVARAEENAWPFYVRRSDPAAKAEQVEAVGPLLFHHTGAGVAQGFRPVFMTTRLGNVAEGNFLYPFFTWRSQPGYRTFSFFQLVNFRSTAGDTPAEHGDDHFDVWPFYFSRHSGDPADDYRALFPVGGVIKHRFGKDQIKFVLFPLYGQTEKGEKRTTHTPWPFIRTIRGGGHYGFEFWPLAGRVSRDGDYDRQFYLWPFLYKSATHLSDPQPDVKIGVLPFYARDTGPGYLSETFLWPFLGYTHRTAPYRYEEDRYFWPFLVQGYGDQRLVNRWAPFYTHSVIKGYDKTWYLWPIYRRAKWNDPEHGLAQRKDQVLFFVYWSLEQRSLTNPAAAPAHKRHLWPLFSSWDNGAGRKQVQALSPFEIFLPNNDKVRQLWTPLFALYRYNAQPETGVRHAFLWNAVTWRRRDADREFHLGPLFSVVKTDTAKRVAFGNGLFGWQRAAPGERAKFFLFDFKMKPATTAPQATTP